MKVNTSEIYIRYITKHKNEIINLKNEIEDLLNSKLYTLNKLTEYKDFLNNFCVISFKGIEQVNFSYINKSLLQSIHQNNEKLKELDERTKRLINVLINIKRQINKNEDRIKELNLLLINSKDFISIIGLFNTKIIDKILTGYIFHLGYSLSYIKIKAKDVSTRKKKKVDWGTSNKLKKEILERGGIPFEVIERTEDGKILTTNNGEHWLNYHNKQIEYLWHWAKGRAPFANKFFYKFKPTYCGASQNGAVQKLRQLETSGSENLKYFY
jgi:hypothetical protein